MHRREQGLGIGDALEQGSPARRRLLPILASPARPVGADQLERMVDHIAAQVLGSGSSGPGARRRGILVKEPQPAGPVSTAVISAPCPFHVKPV